VVGEVINFVHLTRIQNDPPLLLQVWPRVYGGFCVLQGNLVCAQTGGEDDWYCAAWTSDLLSYLVFRTVSPFGPVMFHPSLCLQWAAVTTEVCLLSVVQKLLLSANYICIENVGSHAFRHNYVFLFVYLRF